MWEEATGSCSDSEISVEKMGRAVYRRKDGVYVVPIGCLKP